MVEEVEELWTLLLWMAVENVVHPFCQSPCQFPIQYYMLREECTSRRLLVSMG